MPLESIPPPYPPIPALPLEYSSETPDLLLPVLRALAWLLLALGVCRLVGYSAEINRLGYGIFLGPNRSNGWTLLGGISIGVLQAAAGVRNLRGRFSAAWIWLWIWTSMASQIAVQISSTWQELLHPLPPTSSSYTLLLLTERLAWLPLSCASQLCLLILLIYRRRLIVPKALK